MKRLSELPSRDRETQPLTGTKSVKILANGIVDNVETDFLVTPPILIPGTSEPTALNLVATVTGSITSGTFTVNDPVITNLAAIPYNGSTIAMQSGDSIQVVNTGTFYTISGRSSNTQLSIANPWWVRPSVAETSIRLYVATNRSTTSQPTNSTGLWRYEEQFKEAFSKGLIQTGTIYTSGQTPYTRFTKDFPYYICGDTLIVYLPNCTLADSYYPGSDEIRSYTIANYYFTFKGSTNGDWRFPSCDWINGYEYLTKRYYFTTLGSNIYSGKPLITITDRENWGPHEFIYNYPEATNFRGSADFFNYHPNYSIQTAFTVFCPKLATFPFIKFGIGWTGYTGKYTASIKLYIPLANNSMAFNCGPSQTALNNYATDPTTYASSVTLAPTEYSSISYLLDNINKSPSNGHRNLDYAYFTKKSAAFPADTIQITGTNSDGTEVTGYVPATTDTTDQAVVDAINADATLSTIVFAFRTATTNRVYIRSIAGATLTAITTTDSTNYPVSSITAREASGSPLTIYCGVSEAYGEYTDPEAKTGWKPVNGVTTSYDTDTVNLDLYTNQFLLNCGFKWTINWFPTEHI